MKQYHISYRWIGGERHISKDNLFEFLKLLEEIVDNPQVLQESIIINTTEK